METTQMGKCALCGEEKELQLSHIVPNFVGKRLKSTSPGSIRNTNEPNKVVQDIEKHFMLCHDCEELFSKSEVWFANHIFNPYENKSEEIFDYDENLSYFIISLSWSLYLDLEEFKKEPDFDKNILMTLLHSEKIMREYLLHKRKDIGTIENHIFFMDRIQMVSKIDASKKPSAAMHRSISSYTAYNGKTSFTVSNLLGVLIVTFYSMENNEQWENTQISLGSGRIEAIDQHMTSVVGQEIEFWMDQAEEAKDKLSPAQRQKIEDKFKKLGNNIKNYPIYQDFEDDNNLK